MKIFKKIINKDIIDVQWVLSSILLSSFAHFILRILIGNELGPSGLGIYTLSFTIFQLGMQFAGFGMGSALVKYIAQYIDDKRKIKKFIISGINGSIVSGILIGIIVFFLADIIANHFFNMHELEYLIKLTALSYPFIAIQKSVLGSLNGFRKMKKYAILGIIQNGSIVIFTLFFVLVLDHGLVGSVLGYVAPTIIIGIFSLLILKNYYYLNIRKLFFKDSMNKILYFGFFGVLANSITYLNTQIDSIIIGYFLLSSDVGLYSVAIIISQIGMLLPSAIQSITTPKIATLFGKGEVYKSRKLIFKTIKYGFSITILTAILLALFGNIIIEFFFGSEFQYSRYPLYILLIGFVFSGSISTVGGALGSIGKVNIVFRISTAIVITNVILNIILIPQFGIVGAAIATTLAKVLRFIITIFLLKYYLKK